MRVQFLPGALHINYPYRPLARCVILRQMQSYLNRLVEKAISEGQVIRVNKLKIKSDWTPDITISRDPGSGGHLIAQKIAKKLGWQLFDKTLMLKLSDELHIPTQELLDVDEHGRTWLLDSFHAIFNPSYVSDIRYINHLKKILRHAAKLGDLVILGRGANYILPPDQCLRVRITASFAQRAANTFKYENKESLEEAEAWVRHVQTNRNKFVRQYFGVNPHNPWNYDLVISTDHLSLDQATDLIIQAYLSKFPRERRRLAYKLV